ncbi:unnamed protein product, partial [Pylaiella littoralis]
TTHIASRYRPAYTRLIPETGQGSLSKEASMSFTRGNQTAHHHSHDQANNSQDPVPSQSGFGSSSDPVSQLPEFLPSHAVAAAAALSPEPTSVPSVRKSQRIKAMRCVKAKPSSHDRAVHLSSEGAHLSAALRIV